MGKRYAEVDVVLNNGDSFSFDNAEASTDRDGDLRVTEGLDHYTFFKGSLVYVRVSVKEEEDGNG